MRYESASMESVIIGSSTITRGHRLWYKLGIDVAEAAGEIAPFVGEDEDKKGPAKAARDAAINSPITVMAVVWDIDGKARDNINEAINSVDRQPVKESESRYWILADNSVRPTTADDLRYVMNAYVDRMDDIYNQYGLWLSGDMLSDFVVQGAQ